jgi:peptidyl-prolyl cis-trans isomerase B (cyclophilin B)
MRTTAQTCLLVLAAALVALPSAGWSQAPPGKPAPTPAPKAAAGPAQPSPGAGPIVVVETVKGTFEFETYPDEAPKTVDHILRLVKRGFYNGLRVHRVSPGFVVQMGDPQTRDMTKREWWGRGDFSGSGKPVGVAEFSKTHLHVRGAVAMAHAGNAAEADAQFYVLLADTPRLNGKYAVFGKVIGGMDVVTKLQVADVIKRATIRQ